MGSPLDNKVIFNPLQLEEVLEPTIHVSNDTNSAPVGKAEGNPTSDVPPENSDTLKHQFNPANVHPETTAALITAARHPAPAQSPTYDDSVDSLDVDDLVTPDVIQPAQNKEDKFKRDEDKLRERDDDIRELSEQQSPQQDDASQTQASSPNQVPTSPPASPPSSPPSSPPVITPPTPQDPSVNLVGTFGDDTMIGASGDDTLDGSFGNDVLSGLGGDDRLLGNFGDDQLNGGDGDDYAFGGNGADTIIGGSGNDELRGGLDNDQITGGDGNDYLNGWSGNDSLNGGDGNDTLDGGDGDDVYTIQLDAKGDTDQIIDSSGDDVLVFDDFNPFENVDVVFENGLDLVFSYTEGGNLTLKNFYGDGSIETIRHSGQDYATNADASSPISFADFVNGTADQVFNGTEANDIATTGAGNDRLSGNGGNDILSAGAGDDELVGGTGSDTLNGDEGADTLSGGDGNDILNGGSGNDRILGEYGNDVGNGDAGDDYLFGDFGNDTLSGGDGNDEIRGGFNDDTLFGNADDDFLHGFAGNDILDGGTGTDRLEGGTGRDTFIMRRGYGNDTIADYSVASAGVFFADKIDLSDFGIANFNDLVLSDVNGNTHIDLGSGDALTLEGVNSTSLGADDFSF